MFKAISKLLIFLNIDLKVSIISGEMVEQARENTQQNKYHPEF